jgi:hypothetical protein
MERYRLEARMAQDQSKSGCDDKFIVDDKNAQLLEMLVHRWTPLGEAPANSQVLQKHAGRARIEVQECLAKAKYHSTRLAISSSQREGE